ncbi:unnamed protein product [Echinostoma caproni]|uniref:Uncharacterized protein n=1 Tax=Echinostoma caproni TaxID=27848 RepID=A0A183B2N8_9TREM|nr:unnamed protein product [Echinostoma caproni]
MSCVEFILQLNKQASKCNYGDRLEEELCDRLIAGINNISLQRKMLEKKDITFAEAPNICEQSDDLCAATNADSPVLFHRRSTKPLRDAVFHTEFFENPSEPIMIYGAIALSACCSYIDISRS